MDRAYLRHLPETQEFQISFHYHNEDLKVNRQFHFCRKLSEIVDTFLIRVNTNVEKAINKKKKRKNNLAATSESTEMKLALILNNNEVSKSAMCSEVFAPGNDVILKLLDNSFKIVINAPWVVTIALPSVILANFLIYPTKFETVFTDLNCSEFVWFKSVNKEDWVEVGQGFMYTPTNSDISCYLKLSCTPKNESGEEGLKVEVISDCQVGASPGLCPFEIRQQFTKEKLQGKLFRVVTYNILADLYCTSDYTRDVLHPYCPPYALHIDYRKPFFLKEIMGYNADIICLQEVDRKIFNHDLHPILSYLNYDSDFAIKGGQVAEGLALFFNRNRFQKVNSKRLVLAENYTHPLFQDIWQKIEKNEKLRDRIVEGPTTLQVNILQSLEFDKELLVVANIHLYSKSDGDHIRLLQGGLAIRYVEDIIKKLKENYPGKRVSLIFCGDFNSVPQSGIYKLYTTGHVPADFIDFQSNIEEAVKEVELKQSLQLESACGTPKYTNYTVGFADCLDYIFYEKSNLEVSQVVPLPSFEEITQHTALPSIVFPSDHIALISDLKWK